VIELIEKLPTPPGRTTPLLFVHGAWHAAWCWDQHFLPYFAAHGYHCFALSLRGHGGSDGRDRLRWTRAQDYVDDLEETIRRLSGPPVLVGHSSGGFLAQKYLERAPTAGMVLLASLPPRGAVGVTMRLLRRHPVTLLRANLRLSLAPLVGSPELARELFFSTAMPAAQVAEYQRLLQDESYRFFLDLLALDLVKPSHTHRVPVLILGAGQDRVLTPGEVHHTAAAFGTRAEFIPEITHDMMLDTNWQTAAAHILRWLDNTVP
jgi:pimeloyl-ACP methyl ester carboxylesterase